MFRSLIRGWRQRSYFGRHFSHIPGAIRLGPAGFAVIPWNFAAWQDLDDLLALMPADGRDHAEPLEELESLKRAIDRRFSEEDLISLASSGRASRISWSEVAEIWTYKVDLWSYDDICLWFGRRDSMGVEVAESMPGWKELCEAMMVRFPGIRTDWWNQVVLPAFEPNQALLWKA
jgi:hypothetical protein